MLQTIREHTQGWIAGIIISVIILTFALWGIHSYFEGGLNNDLVAEVNGVAITKNQLAGSYERLRRQAQAQFGANSSATKDDGALRIRALQGLVDIEVLKQASTSQGFLVSNGQIDNYLESMPDFQVNGQFSMERFQELLSSTLLSTSEFLELIKTSLLIDQPKLGVIFTSFALPDEVNYTYGLVNQERDIQYITIPFQSVATQSIVVPAEKIQSYYDQHKNEFMTPEQVNVEYIQLSLKELSTTINPTSAMLTNFYNENINSYTQPTKWKLKSVLIPVAAMTTKEDAEAAQKKAEDVIRQLKQGGNDAALTKEYPDAELSADLITLNQVPADLQKSVAALTEAGQVSGMIKTSKGIVVVKAVDVQAPKMQTFDEVKDKVKEAYIRQHAEEKFAQMRDQLADVTYEHPDSLQLASKLLNLPIKTSDLFQKDKAGQDIAQYKKVRDVAFSNDVLNLQNNSDVIQLNPETVIVIRVKSHVASTLLPLKDLSKQIEDKLKAQEAELRVAKAGEELVAKLRAGTPLAGYTWSTPGFMGRYSTKVDSAILDMAFSLPNPSISGKMSYGVTRIPTGYAIVAVKAVKDGQITDKKEYTVFAEQVQNSMGLLEYQLYKESEASKAKIKIIQQS